MTITLKPLTGAINLYQEAFLTHIRALTLGPTMQIDLAPER